MERSKHSLAKCSEQTMKRSSAEAGLKFSLFVCTNFTHILHKDLSVGLLCNDMPAL
jgi:hypothetical protein